MRIPATRSSDSDFTPNQTRSPKKLPENMPCRMKLLLGLYPQGTPAAFCDGSVRLLSKKIDSKTILALLTTAGGKLVEIP